MYTLSKPLAMVSLLALLACENATDQKQKTEMNNPANPYATLDTYLAERKQEFEQIEPMRKEALTQIAAFVSGKLKSAQIPQLTFICTHNSRRSHMSQIWAMTAARSYGIAGVECYSGGTEATAFNSRAVAAMERAGFKIETVTEGDNPIYHVYYAEDAVPVKAFSKVYDDSKNPRKEFCAVMTCSQADEACPVVLGAEERISIPYNDPKESDGTPDETKVYDERCKQIAREMAFLFSLVTI